MALTRRFMGKHAHTLDVKGRVIVPAKYREALAPYPIITIDDNHLTLYPDEAWEEIMKQYDTIPEDDHEAQRIVRYKVSSAFEAEVDKQGRMLIPQYLRERVGLEKDIIFVGMINRVEIWDVEAYNAETASVKEQESELREKIRPYREKYEERRNHP